MAITPDQFSSDGVAVNPSITTLAWDGSRQLANPLVMIQMIDDCQLIMHHFVFTDESLIHDPALCRVVATEFLEEC